MHVGATRLRTLTNQTIYPVKETRKYEFSLYKMKYQIPAIYVNINIKYTTSGEIKNKMFALSSIVN